MEATAISKTIIDAPVASAAPAAAAPAPEAPAEVSAEPVIPTSASPAPAPSAKDTGVVFRHSSFMSEYGKHVLYGATDGAIAVITVAASVAVAFWMKKLFGDSSSEN